MTHKVGHVNSTIVKIKNSFIPLQNRVVKLLLNPPHCQFLVTIYFSFSVCMVLAFLECCVNGITWYVTFLSDRFYVHAKSFQPYPTLCYPIEHSPPGSSVYGILQARILEWVAISYSRRSSQPTDWILVT